MLISACTFMARTVAPMNGLNVQREKNSDRSIILSGLRRSGLSVPYSSIACAYEMTGNGNSVTFAAGANFLKVSYSTICPTSNTSSCVENAISKSSW